MEVDYGLGNCGTSVTTPFVLTQSGSCQQRSSGILTLRPIRVCNTNLCDLESMVKKRGDFPLSADKFPLEHMHITLWWNPTPQISWFSLCGSGVRRDAVGNFEARQVRDRALGDTVAPCQ